VPDFGFSLAFFRYFRFPPLLSCNCNRELVRGAFTDGSGGNHACSADFSRVNAVEEAETATGHRPEIGVQKPEIGVQKKENLMKRTRTKMRILSIRLFATIFLAAMTLSCIPVASADDCDRSLKASVSDPHQVSGITGSAELCIDRDHATVSERTENLISGHAYTTWFAYINDPAQCGNYIGGTPGVCGDNDGVLPFENPSVVFGRMDGAIADESGRLQFTGNFRDLRFSHGSTVWIIMFEHGPASTTDNRYLARQLLTPQLPGLGAPGLGAPADGNVGHPVALAVFNIP
jgi:hypothetical protein